MAKLIVLALAFTALVAFASAHSTIVSTTLIEEENPSQQQQQCSQQIQGGRVNQCKNYLQQGQSWYELSQQGGLQSCCQELQNFQGQCQCEAVQEAFRQAAQQMMQQQQQGQQQQDQIRQLMQRAQNLPNQCTLQTRQCQVGPISITTTTTTIANPQQMCQHIRQRQFNQCQNYVQQQQRGSLLMSFNRQGQQQQGLQQCCNELQNVEQQCQCEAMQEVYRQAQQQMQQQRAGQMQSQDLQQIVQNLGNQCHLQAQQCQIPYTMF